MANFTPGPWEWSTSNSWRRLSSAGKDGNVMYPTIDRHDNHPNLDFPNGGFEGPDARLIAAATDLYKALDRAQYLLHAAYRFIEANPIKDYEVFYDEASCDGACLMDDCNIAIKAAREALAKADGKAGGA